MPVNFVCLGGVNRCCVTWRFCGTRVLLQSVEIRFRERLPVIWGEIHPSAKALLMLLQH